MVGTFKGSLVVVVVVWQVAVGEACEHGTHHS